MIKYENDNNTKKIYIWKNDNPLDVISDKKIVTEVNAKEVFWNEGMICVEAKLNSRHISNYAMICMSYRYNIIIRLKELTTNDIITRT